MNSDEKDDESEDKDKEETKKTKPKRKSSSSFVALKCTVCEHRCLVLSEKAKREHEKSKRHEKRVASLPLEDERKKTTCISYRRRANARSGQKRRKRKRIQNG